MIKSVIQNSKYASLLIVFTLLISFMLSLIWGVAKAISAWREILSSLGKSETISMLLIQLIDAFLFTIVLYMLAASVYQMFIGPIGLPNWMVAENLNELKAKLSSVMVMVITVRFVEFLFEGTHSAMDILLLALAIGFISAILIYFSYYRSKEDNHG